jgi:putative membrane protein
MNLIGYSLGYDHLQSERLVPTHLPISSQRYLPHLATNDDPPWSLHRGTRLPSDTTILRDYLRDEVCPIPQTEPFFKNASSYEQAHHKPLYTFNEIVRGVEKLREEKILSHEQMLFINAELYSFIDITGACERIKNSPIPFSYSLFLKKSLFVYIITMPVPFAAEFGYWAVLAVMVIFYTFASLEIVSEEVEEPFGTEANDLPTDELAEKIYRDVGAIRACATLS